MLMLKQIAIRGMHTEKKIGVKTVVSTWIRSSRIKI
jgi:hypothetical protein